MVVGLKMWFLVCGLFGGEVSDVSLAQGLFDGLECGELSWALLGDHYGVFVVGGWFAVFGAAGPSVGFDHYVAASEVDHRFDGYA